MKISAIKEISKRKNADCLIVPFFEDKKPIPASVIKDIDKDIKWCLEVGDFTGKLNQVSLIYVQGRKEKRILLLGLGKKDKLSSEGLRNAIAEAIKKCQKLKSTKINMLYPEKCKLNNLYQNVLEGACLSNYFFHRLKKDTLKEDLRVLVREITLVGVEKNQKLIDKIDVIVTANHMARDLVNNNADDETPEKLGKVAKELEKLSSKLKVTVFDKKRIVKEKLDLLLAVNRGSFRDPAFIIVEYIGDKKSKDKTALIGKGVTYDSGGLSLKPANAMNTMKCDMSGAAAVLGVMYAIARLNLKKNVTAIIPATENSIGSKSYKPGDVYSSYSGKTVEVDNTDAEGRLILADALAYAAKNVKPTRMIDIATLTGAISIALGDEIAGIFSNNKDIVKRLQQASDATGELLWDMPLHNEYISMLKSDFADIKNSAGRSASSITAALFLQEFVNNVPWVHIDIAGTAYYSKPKGYNTSLATGYGVRLICEFLENL